MPLISTIMPDLSHRFVDSGRYQLLNPLGSGAFGVVYRSRERIPNSTRTILRAIKVSPIPPTKTSRWLHQAREASLHKVASPHPNVVTLYRVFRDRDYVYFVMEYCAGGDLFKIVKKQRTLARNDALLRNVFLQILDGVEGCHAKGVYHRDIKPENIFVNESLTQVYVGDFGLATHMTQSTSFNTGSKQYMSPECVDCGDSLYPYETQRSDVWALGITLLQLATGRVSWHKATMEDQFFVSFLENPDYLRTTLPISAGLNDILRRVFTIIPADALTLSEFRRLVRNLDTFWMSEEEVAASNTTVQHCWDTYSPQRYEAPQSTGDSATDNWVSAYGDVLASDTSSESSEPLKDDSNDSNEKPLPHTVATEALLNAEEGLPDNAALRVSQDPPSLPALELPPAAALRALSYPELPTRPQPAFVANGKLLASDGTPPTVDSSGPITPAFRPHDPPGIVLTEPLDNRSGVQAGRRVSADDKSNGPRRLSLILWSLMTTGRAG